MTYDQINRERIISYFMSGEKAYPLAPQLGVEFEHIIVFGPDAEPVSYEAHRGVIGVRDLLEYLATYYPKRSYNSEGDLIGLAADDGYITIEPAAQVEISTVPYTDLDKIRAAYRRFRVHAGEFLKEHNCRFADVGYHPSAKASDLELVPKKRYECMDAYFAKLGLHGERMMRGSASLQVSIDYSSEDDAVRKLRIASVLTPIFTAITDNMPVFEAQENHAHLRRLAMWRDVDPKRCGAIPGLFDEDFGYAAYADWILRTSPIFFMRRANDDPSNVQVCDAFDRPTREIYRNTPMTEDDVDHLISMFWPDVRLRRFIEIRQADYLPEDLAMRYIALIKGLFYSDDALTMIEELCCGDRGFCSLSTKDIDAAIAEISVHGLDGVAYGLPLRDWIDVLFDAVRRTSLLNE